MLILRPDGMTPNGRFFLFMKGIKKMQAWDQVKVIETGEAGVIQEVNAEEKTAKVKLDLHEEPQEFSFADLQKL